MRHNKMTKEYSTNRDQNALDCILEGLGFLMDISIENGMITTAELIQETMHKTVKASQEETDFFVDESIIQAFKIFYTYMNSSEEKRKEIVKHIRIMDEEEKGELLQ